MEFRIEKALEADYREMAWLIQKVWDSLANKEWFAADNAEYTYGILAEGKGLGYKAVEAETGALAGVFMVTFPGKDEENLGYDIGLPEKELDLVAHMDSAAILPEYRGNHLQYQMMQEAEADLRERGFRYLMCTVHPENSYSRDNVLRQGYEVMATKEKYGGYLRDILMKQVR